MKKELLARQVRGLSLGLTVLVSCHLAAAADWTRFHGSDGSGVSLDKQPLPTTWSETENLKWKAKLPGPGSSSPIVIGRRVVVTCWTGYGAEPGREGDQKDLRRHVLCFDRDSGKVLWDQVVEPVLPEDRLLRPVHPARVRHAHAGLRRQADLRLLRQDGRAGLRSGRQEALANGRRHRLGDERLGFGFQPDPV